MDRRVTQLNRTKRNCNQLKTYTNFVYGWCPEDPSYKKDQACNQKGVKKLCTAVPFSQGEDWDVTYVYKIDISNGIPKRIAYVACDYVE
jgi:hypothetical protein